MLLFVNDAATAAVVVVVVVVVLDSLFSLKLEFVMAPVCGVCVCTCAMVMIMIRRNSLSLSFGPGRRRSLFKRSQVVAGLKSKSWSSWSTKWRDFLE